MVIPEKPIGGTELMFNELGNRIDPKLLERYSIFNYIHQADFNKKTIYWNQLATDQEAVQFLKDEDLRNRIDYFVFVSHWQAETFRKTFSIPGYKTWVIQNAALPIEKKNFDVLSDKIKVCYTSTPWRGLDVLLDAWERIDTTNCELHVFSSTKIYGTDFHSTTNHIYEKLFERASSMKNVVYRDFTPNEELRQELPQFDILAYPCVFEETSCISVIEALSAGLKVICSNIGALPETTEGWANIYPIKVDNNVHANYFASLLDKAIKTARTPETIASLKTQADIYHDKWSWSNRIKDWANFFQTIFLIEEQIEQAQQQIQQNIETEDVIIDFDVPEFSSNDLVIDIGGYVGSFAQRCIDSGAGSVHVFEPNPENFTQIARILTEDKIKVDNLAVWSKDDLIISFTNNGRNSTAFTESTDLRVATIKLDTVLESYDSVRFLKVSAVGSEYPILLSSTLLNKVKEIVAEVNIIDQDSNLKQPLSWRKEGSIDQIFEHLNSLGFEVKLEETKNSKVMKLYALNLNNK